ncbi:tetratricopeptide repeat protein [Cryobacterium sp. GrIS_2_6]|uniref:tetratricopeptide repeat protein n=1 Tax=Cryobacterium sp. GrIS_2_6 TaxID=3162785 RepID=UPI002E014CA4|nr:putative thioredoxin [Cryobacterium psychrotolerans]
MSIVPPSAASMRGAVDLSSLLNRPPAPAAGGAGSTGAPGQAGQAGAVPVPSLVFQGTDANFGEILNLSANVPVIVDLWSARSEQSAELTLVLTRLILEFGGRFVLATVDVDTNPQLVQAFQAQSIPTVAAVIGGQPVALFNGVIAEDQVRAVLERVLVLAAEHGVVGTAVAPEGADAATPVAPPEPELPPHHVEAYEAIERGDYAAASAIYKTALARDPRDNLSVAGLAQVGLLARLQGKTLAEIRAAAAAAPDDLEAQLLVADLDLSGGHVEDAFDRLLTLFPAQDAAAKNRIRERILDLFEVVGQDDPRVAPTRKRLTMLLY